MATFTITPTPKHNVTYGFKDDMFDFESNPPKPALYDAAPDLAERLARSSDGSAHDVAAVARLWDPSCSVHQRIGRPDLLVVQSCTELPDVAKEHIRLASQAAVNIQYEIADPWVKVGTTTIDGTMMHVAAMLQASAWGPPCSDHEAETHIDHFVSAGGPWLIGGRHLLAKGSHINSHAGTALVRCDIVRRQSEIDAEHVSRVTAEFHKDDAYAAPVCPECGPHGNAARVLLLESWVDCGTCKPTATAVAFDEEVEVQRVAALRSSLTEATVDNLRRYEALMADFKAAITIPNTPHVHMTFDPVGHRPGEFSFAASDLCMPTHSRAPFAVAADVGQEESTLGAVRYPTRDEYANYLSAHLATNLGAVDYDDPSISRAARMLSGGQWLLVASQALVP